MHSRIHFRMAITCVGDGMNFERIENKNTFYNTL